MMTERNTDEDYSHVRTETLVAWARNIAADIRRRLQEMRIPPGVGMTVGGSIWAYYAIARNVPVEEAVRQLTETYEEVKAQAVSN